MAAGVQSLPVLCAASTAEESTACSEIARTLTADLSRGRAPRRRLNLLPVWFRAGPSAPRQDRLDSIHVRNPERTACLCR